VLLELPESEALPKPGTTLRLVVSQSAFRQTLGLQNPGAVAASGHHHGRVNWLCTSLPCGPAFVSITFRSFDRFLPQGMDTAEPSLAWEGGPALLGEYEETVGTQLLFRDEVHTDGSHAVALHSHTTNKLRFRLPPKAPEEAEAEAGAAAEAAAEGAGPQVPSEQQQQESEATSSQEGQQQEQQQLEQQQQQQHEKAVGSEEEQAAGSDVMQT
jgi:hypothetical protein